ncbi:hypothetical protein J4468_00045 [Candidatus Woesearchaeota archaeon]|nr:hypothetical protein [Candidatus Woesearchaeota archaeon]
MKMKRVIIAMLIVVTLFLAGCGKSDITGNAILTCEEYKSQLDSCLAEKDNMKEYITSLETGQGITQKINLESWKTDDIPPELAKLNPDLFMGKNWIYYEYDKDGAYFDVNGPVYGKDVFADLRYVKYERTRQREYNVSHLRIFPATEAEFKEYKGMVEKFDIKSSDLTCEAMNSCFDMSIIECHAFGKVFVAWHAGPYLFLTREESFNPVMVKLFEKFYC